MLPSIERTSASLLALPVIKLRVLGRSGISMDEIDKRSAELLVVFGADFGRVMGAKSIQPEIKSSKDEDDVPDMRI